VEAGNRHYAVALKGQKHYLLEEFQIKERVGRVGDDSPLLTIYDEQEGQKHAGTHGGRKSRG
jgi:hypothetical protein